ncbi:hypothetical protein G5B30_06755 [Sphingobacterium sp. SGG-5]|uniref:hypothetical protein n=1 Tax=Sphingobacterium sp. SGG-5 TaxID=2710881 RepID=UPI0013EBA105|nr:hypothetical protein [Sphingobacterium sp. SGG-5]NGM61615.1 hypothetical protein [Sphingobacterium sp. SGG-5]
MKRVYSKIWIVGLMIVFVGSCTKDSLLFPPTVDREDSDEVIDVIAKPSDTRLLGDYDYHFKIKWPMMSDKVAKVVINYIDNGVDKSEEFTDFSEDGLIETSEYGEYVFTMTTHGKDGQISKPVTIAVTNKGFMIEEVLENAVISMLDGEVEVKLANDNEIPIKTTITYPGPSGTLSKVVNSSDELIVTEFPAQDGTHSYTVELEDEQGRKTSKTYSYTFEYVVSMQLQSLFNEGSLIVSNNAHLAIAKVKVTYPTETGTAFKELTNIASGSSVTFPAMKGSNLNVAVEYEDAAGRSLNRSLTYSYNPALIYYNTAELRAGWTPYASNSNSKSEGPPTFMLDSDPNKIWHTKWSTTTTSNHPANEKYPFTLIFTFTKTRMASPGELFGETNLMNPTGPYNPILVTEVELLHRAANNRRVKDVQVYGVDLQGNEINFGQFTLSNSVQSTVLPLKTNGLTNTVPLKGVKIICLTTFHATDQFANFNEIFVRGYAE